MRNFIIIFLIGILCSGVPFLYAGIILGFIPVTLASVIVAYLIHAKMLR